MELLSPAGDWNAMQAAVRAGADAVYLGYTAFGARGYAGNFDEETLREAIRYCHLRGKRVYVTVNTLILPQEMKGLEAVLTLLAESHADAAIVQDLGVVRTAQAMLPGLPLHASTQMGLHNRQGAAFAKAMGLCRVVPARECALSEIAQIATQGVEVEAFVHGAMCASMSGQCLFSSLIGGRSGNRGRCAQPCRLPYTFMDRKDYAMSMRDLCLLGDLEALQNAGVTSLKIEGRMKRPEYVSVVTGIYRRRLDALTEGRPLPGLENDLYELRQVFHRGGFTRGYAMGQAHADVVETTRPNHGGIPVGEVLRGAKHAVVVRLTEALHDGDFLQLRGETEDEITYRGAAVPAGQDVELMVGERFRPGDVVARLTDPTQAARLAFEEAKIPIRMELVATPDALPQLKIDDGHFAVEVYGAAPAQPAQKQPLSPEVARAQLEKLGDTPFVLEGLDYTPQGAFLPVSAINALRRAAVEELTRQRVERPALKRHPYPRETAMPSEAPRLIAQVQDLARAGRCVQAGVEEIYWQPEDYRQAALREALPRYTGAVPLFLVLPVFTESDLLRDLHAFVEQDGRFAGVVATNPGQLMLDWAMPVRGEASLHVTNARAARQWAQCGVGRLTLSPELNAAQIREVLREGGAYELVAYGRETLMMLSFCPRRCRQGATASTDCAQCEKTPLPPLVDRKGYSFPMRRMHAGGQCRVQVMNSLPTYIGKHADKLAGLPLSLRAVFRDEDDETIERVLTALADVLAGRPAASLPFESTGGHLGRGVQ